MAAPKKSDFLPPSEYSFSGVKRKCFCFFFTQYRADLKPNMVNIYVYKYIYLHSGLVTLVSGRTMGKDRKLVTKSAPPQTAKGNMNPLG